MNGYATFRDNSFMIPVGLMGDFLHEELRGAKA